MKHFLNGLQSIVVVAIVMFVVGIVVGPIVYAVWSGPGMIGVLVSGAWLAFCIGVFVSWVTDP